MVPIFLFLLLRLLLLLLLLLSVRRIIVAGPLLGSGGKRVNGSFLVGALFNRLLLLKLLLPLKRLLLFMLLFALLLLLLLLLFNLRLIAVDGPWLSGGGAITGCGTDPGN